MAKRRKCVGVPLIDVAMYKSVVYVCATREQVAKLDSHFKVEPTTMSALALSGRYYCTQTKDAIAFFIYCPPDELAALAHECVHVANRIFHFVQHEPDRDNDEPTAYLVEFLFGEAYKHLQRHACAVGRKA